MLQKDVDIDEDVRHRISAGWLKRRQASGVLCDYGWQQARTRRVLLTQTRAREDEIRPLNNP